MNTLSTIIPNWVSVLFLICFVSPIYLIAKAVKEGATNAQLSDALVNSYYKKTLFFFFAYYVYVIALSFTGLFLVNTFPPKVILFTTLPLMLFYFLFFSRTQFYKTLFENINLSTLVRLHIFRFIGTFFLIVWYYGALPPYFALSAGLGDIFAAVTAIIVAKLIDNKHKHYKAITFVWNIIGLIDIGNALVTAMRIAKLGVDTSSETIFEIARFPFSLIPAFAPATIIFLHILIFKKLKKH